MGNSGGFLLCPYREQCCMRDDFGNCLALSDVEFSDGRCHFRKEYQEGKNLYDNRGDTDNRLKFELRRTKRTTEEIIKFLRGNL